MSKIKAVKSKSILTINNSNKHKNLTYSIFMKDEGHLSKVITKLNICTKFNFATANKIHKMLLCLKQEYFNFKEKRDEIIKKYIQTDENGKVKTENNKILLRPDTELEYEKEFESLWNTPIQLPEVICRKEDFPVDKIFSPSDFTILNELLTIK